MHARLDKRDRLPILAIWLLTGTILTLGFRFVPFLKVAENGVYDLRLVLAGVKHEPNQNIVIVSITEATLAQLPYRSPIDRRFLSNLLTNLSQKGARLIAVDVLFDQPTEESKDQELLRTLTRLSPTVVCAWATLSDGLTQLQSDYLNDYLVGYRTGSVRAITTSEDETVRNVYLRAANSDEPSAMSAVLARLSGVAVPNLDFLRLDFAEGETGFRTFPAHTISVLPDKWFTNKIVLVGADLPFVDRHRTPLALISDDATMPGVVIHAHALAQLIRESTLSVPGSSIKLTLNLCMAALGVLLSVIVIRPRYRYPGALLVVVSFWLLTLWLARESNLLLPMVAPTLSFFLAISLCEAVLRRRANQQQAFIRNAFDKFLAPAYVEQLVEEPGLLVLAGEEREITSVFTDIAGFTSLSERLEPPVLVEMLNQYFEGAFKVVLNAGGTVDKVVGDALHLMFNAPNVQEDHAERAVACALAIDDFSRTFQKTLALRGIDFGVTRVGINSGLANVGNFGGPTRFDYTAHGPTINTASRLEGANKYFGTTMAVSENTKGRCPNQKFRPIGRIALVGVGEPILVFEPIAPGSVKDRFLPEYLAAYELMSSGVPSAIDSFDKLLATYSDDPLVIFHAKRLQSHPTYDLIVLSEK